MHWRDNTPQVDTLRKVIAHPGRLGRTPAVIFDANAGYLLASRYQDGRVMARALGLPEARVPVVPKGTIADAYLLTVARDYSAPV